MFCSLKNSVLKKTVKLLPFSLAMATAWILTFPSAQAHGIEGNISHILVMFIGRD